MYKQVLLLKKIQLSTVLPIMTNSWIIKVSGDVVNLHRNNQLLAKSNGEI